MFQTHTMVKQDDFIGTIGVTTKNKLEVGLIKDDHNKIIEFYEKPNIGQFGWSSWTGRVIFEQEIMQYLDYDEDIATNVFPQILDRLYAYKSDSEWYDIGNIIHYNKVNKLAKENKLW